MKFKISTLSNRKFRCGYLYEDGHAVIVYEKKDKIVGHIQFVEIVEKVRANCTFRGRIVFQESALLTLAANAQKIFVEEPSVTAGSAKTRELGIAIGCLTIQLGFSYYDSVCFFDMPGVLSGRYTYQPEVAEVFDSNLKFWSDYPVGKIIFSDDKSKVLT